MEHFLILFFGGLIAYLVLSWLLGLGDSKPNSPAREKRIMDDYRKRAE